MNEVSIVEAAVKSKAIKPGVFSGMLRQWQQTAYMSLIHAGIMLQVAHKVCCDYAADIGRAMATDGKFKSKIGKLSDDGERSIAMTGKSVIKTSDSMSVVYVAQTLDTLFREELLGTRKLPVLSSGLQEYLEKCQKWVAEQEWEMPKE